MAILQGALLSTQPARTHRSVRITADFVVLIHELNHPEGWRDYRGSYPAPSPRERIYPAFASGITTSFHLLL